MTWEQVSELSQPSRLGPQDQIFQDLGDRKPLGDGREYRWVCGDGSVLGIAFGPWREGNSHAISIYTEPPPSVLPMTLLRRTLARILPALGD
jgi:hypothetical protein